MIEPSTATMAPWQAPASALSNSAGKFWFICSKLRRPLSISCQQKLTVTHPHNATSPTNPTSAKPKVVCAANHELLITQAREATKLLGLGPAQRHARPSSLFYKQIGHVKGAHRDSTRKPTTAKLSTTIFKNKKRCHESWAGLRACFATMAQKPCALHFAS